MCLLLSKTFNYIQDNDLNDTFWEAIASSAVVMLNNQLNTETASHAYILID